MNTYQTKLFKNHLSKIPYGSLGLILFCLVILAVSLRGLPGNPNAGELNTAKWKEKGPFELSPERGRFALLYSMIEDNSFQFSDTLGEFAKPDVAVSKGRYVSRFAPLLSFITIPGYIIGKFLGASQVAAFAVVSVFALFNFLLIRAIAIRLKANRIAATLGAAVFLFATPAFAYAVDLYQHHISTFLILLSVHILLKTTKAWTLIIVFFLSALAIPLDYPNLFFMLPIAVFALGRIISFNKIKNAISIKINPLKILIPLIAMIPILFFLWFNQVSFGDPFQISGTLPSAKSAPLQVKPATSTALEAQFAAPISTSSAANTIQGKNPTGSSTIKRQFSVTRAFQTRNIPNGFYLQFLSPDRGIIYFTPVILLGFLGVFLAYKRKIKMLPLLITIAGTNILLYAMWGDPWGGWAFGSRYLIPSYAILSIFISLLLSYWRKSILFLAVFIILFGYSAAVNTLGAITTSAMPPQVEVLNLEKLSGIVQRYTYQRNWEFLLAGNSKSFVYQTIVRKYFSPLQYYEILIGLIVLAGLSLTTFLYLQKGKGNE